MAGRNSSCGYTALARFLLVVGLKKKSNQKLGLLAKNLYGGIMNKKQFQIKNKKSNKKDPKLTHDRLFKLFYSQTTFTKELLKLIFSKEELKVYDLNKLEAEKDTFGEKRADLVFSFPLKAYPEKKIKVFILLEHKSKYVKGTFTQLLSYQIEMRHPVPGWNFAPPF